MAPDMIIALVGFAFVMSISPGPGNLLLLTSGANFGFVRSLPLAFGISAGFLSMVLAIGLGLGPLLRQAPAVFVVLRIACVAYVLWLAWQIRGSRSLGSDEAAAASPIGFVQAAMLQLVNPKAWTVALIVTVSYTDPARLVPSLLTMIALFALVNLPSISVWALCGAALRRALAKDRHIVVFNRVMAILLAASMIPALLHAA